jgi:hypothetical protein
MKLKHLFDKDVAIILAALFVTTIAMMFKEKQCHS